MCIIVCIPADKKIPTDKVLTHCWEQNPHKGGFMYVRDDGTKPRLVIKKVNTPEELIQGVHKVKQKYDTPIVIHMRWATNGKINLDNAHPFRINKEWGFVHNGAIHKCSTSTQADKSDTREFRDKILREIPLNILTTGSLKTGLGKLIEDYIGFSKLAFLNTNKEVVIIGEERGDWVEGVWYSNDYYKKTRFQSRGRTIVNPTQNTQRIQDSPGSVSSVRTPDVGSVGGGSHSSRKCSHCTTSYGTVYNSIFVGSGRAFHTPICVDCRMQYMAYMTAEYGFLNNTLFKCLDCEVTFNKGAVKGKWSVVFDFDSCEIYGYCSMCADKRIYGDLIILRPNFNRDTTLDRLARMETDFLETYMGHNESKEV